LIIQQNYFSGLSSTKFLALLAKPFFSDFDSHTITNYLTRTQQNFMRLIWDSMEKSAKPALYFNNYSFVFCFKIHRQPRISDLQVVPRTEQQISKKNRERSQYTSKPRIYPCRNVLSSNMSTLRWGEMRGDREEMEQNIKQWRTTTNRLLGLLPFETLHFWYSCFRIKKSVLSITRAFPNLTFEMYKENYVTLKLKLNNLNKIHEYFSSWNATVQMIELSFYH